LFAATSAALAQDTGAGGSGTSTNSLEADQQAAESQDSSAAVPDTNAGPGTDVEVASTHEKPELSHEGQFEMRLGFGVPYVFAIRYKDGPDCDDLMRDFCRRFGSPFLDVELGYGATPTLEVNALMRLGVTNDDAAHELPLVFGLGLRSYTSADTTAKLFLGGRILLDATQSDIPNWGSVDVGFRGEFGLALDFAHYVGAYVQLGETLAILRGLYFVTDLSIGVQGRIP